MGFNLDDYEPVAARIARFYEQHPDGRIITDLVHYLQDVAVFKAEIWIGDVLVATGWAEEVRNQGNVNRTSHVENAETSSVGRGLSNYNLSGSSAEKRPSREEMSKVQRMSGNTTITENANLATEAQRNAIIRISKAKGKTVPNGLEGWTKRQASEYMDILMGKAEEPLPPEEPF